MLTQLFDFELPSSFIAQNPVSPRDHCKLLIYDTSKDQIYHKRFFEIEEFLSKDDVLVLNSSKVIPARILFEFQGRRCEVFVLKELGDFEYEILVKPGKVFKLGHRIFLDSKVFLDVIGIDIQGLRKVKANADLLSLGQIPLPPYIQNSTALFEDYQTVYASTKGSVAAPTAGLHFTKPLMDRLENEGIEFEEVTLHVGLGTFLPVKMDQVEDHFMHSEYYELSSEVAANLNKAKAENKRVIAVGTTSVRVLETCFESSFEPGFGETNIFIYPNKHKWKVVDALITNFHLPKSTLLMLVASFLENKGVNDPIDKLLSLYEIAKQEDYRFYSFGDAMFIF